jgi:hypothetical protein
MNLLKSKLSVAIAAGLLSGSALAAEISCPITPAYSIITEGQTLQLTAECTGGVLASIDWQMNGTSVTGVVPLTDYLAGNPIKYTTPVGLGDASETQEFTFTVVGEVGTGDTFVSTPAKVVVKPSSAVVALAKGVALDPAAPTKKVDAECGTADAATVANMPASTAQCATGSTVTLPISGPQYFTWSCLSLTGGAEASCYALREGYVAPVEPTATVNGACGSAINSSFSSAPTANLCSTTYGNTSVATGSTYTWTCNGSNAAVTSDDTSCSATIATASNQPPTGDPGIGSGLWVPPYTTNRTVADQSGNPTDRISYVPGCLNGEFASASSSGCSLKTSFTGLVNGSSGTVSLGSGKQLVLRYQSEPTAGTSIKYFKVKGFDGGNVSVNMRVWLSTDPAASYANVAPACKTTSTRVPVVFTGPGYCPIVPNAVYYLGIEYDEAVQTRFQIDEMQADFQ